MASLSGENEIRFNKISDIGLRVEGYFNLCEHESEHAGVKVYHAIVEVIDDRGGIAVPVQVLPLFNDDVNAVVEGHFEIDASAEVLLSEKVEEVLCPMSLVFSSISAGLC